ncbi:MAG: ABC-type uncharacterized transport system permease subunit [Pirellulaceae bacterium]|jgi:ABC-type uncharacterized transport system permease subunit
MLSGISISCFACSYSITLLMELSRLFFRAPIRFPLMLVFTVLGLFTQLVYLVLVTQTELQQGRTTPLASWHDWCLMASWVIAAAYLGLIIRRPEKSLGIFLLPLVLGLIVVAHFYQDAGSFARHEALSIWRVIHGSALLVGTAAVILGFASGIMYLLQSNRLKKKVPPRQGLQLPSLEWLQRFNRESLLISTALLAAGLVSGIALNLIQTRTISWTDPVVLSSGVLFVWLISATIFEWVYKPAHQGRKVAYLTMASFVFLGLALWFVLQGGHAGQVGAPKPGTTSNVPVKVPVKVSPNVSENSETLL